MNAEEYVKEKERLSLAMNGGDRLTNAMNDIAETLGKYNLDKMPGTALDMTVLTLETLHLNRLNLRNPRP